ncbi:MAG: stage V sporulation protein AC [Clostridiaceae bacterium]|nr:stage V sporulation protein AC [Clostridiaceae bacterium]
MQQVMTRDEYRKYVDKVSPNSRTLRNTLRAFMVGGVICVIGQFFLNSFKNMGLNQETAGSVTSIVMILLGVTLTALNLYDDLGRFAGAGSIVPITGFANSIASPAIEYKSEGYVLGIGARMFLVAGPVLVYGISVSIIVGIIRFLLKS